MDLCKIIREAHLKQVNELLNQDEETKGKEEGRQRRAPIFRLTNSVKIVYEIIEADAHPTHMWRCLKKSVSDPYELIMSSKDFYSRGERLDQKLELGSYNTELLQKLMLRKPENLPLYANKLKNYTPPVEDNTVFIQTLVSKKLEIEQQNE